MLTNEAATFYLFPSYPSSKKERILFLNSLPSSLAYTHPKVFFQISAISHQLQQNYKSLDLVHSKSGIFKQSTLKSSPSPSVFNSLATG